MKTYHSNCDDRDYETHPHYPTHISPDSINVMNKVFTILFLCFTGLVGLLTEFIGTSFASERIFQSNLPDCKGPHPVLVFNEWTDCFGKANYWHEGRTYTGEFKDNRWHGMGVLEFTYSVEKSFTDYEYIDVIYEGQFVLGKKNGRGKQTWENGQSLSGIWKDDDLVEGKHTLQSGVVVYQGQFKDLKYHGKGRLMLEFLGYEKGDFFDGSFKNGEFWNGEGKMTSENGEVFEGEFKNSSFANGKYIWPNGDSYVGEMFNKEFHGFGTFIQLDIGETYSGYWKNGDRHGAGTTINNDGSSFEGEFRDNRYWNGTGTVVYRDAESNITGTYEGQYSNGYRNGRGKYVADNSVQEGIWKDNVLQTAKKEESKETKPNVADIKPAQDPGKVIAAATGSGFAVSADGYVITNHHVIDGCEKVFVHTSGKTIATDLVTYDQQNDLALLKADFKPEAVFPLSNTRPELLQDIYVAGYPFGKKVSSSVKVTKGIISSLTGINNNFARVQIDAAIQTGNSGGPILDVFGNVVGVAVAKLDVKYALENFGSIPENTNFGIKSSVVESVLDSNGVNSPPANEKPISKSELGKRISKGTYYISCWMTMAQIEKMRTRKVMFSGLD